MRGAAAGESVRIWVIAGLGFVAGLCAMSLMICLCSTLCGRDNRVGQSRESMSGGERSSSQGKSLKKWITLDLSLSSKRLLSMGKNKAIRDTQEELTAYDVKFVEQEAGDRLQGSPVWQRSILMGERCEPPSFSGHIFYDAFGNRVDDFPFKSPRAAYTPPSLAQSV